jgi:hypothetical protein
MLKAAADAYGWPGGPLVDSILDTVRAFQDIVVGDRGAEEWAATELAYLEQNVDVFRAYLEG